MGFRVTLSLARTTALAAALARVFACRPHTEVVKVTSNEAALAALPADSDVPEAGASLPSTDAGSAASPLVDASDAAPAPALRGSFIGRGLWGVHNTGNLRVRIHEGACEATYNAEGSYFCSTSHRLRCTLVANGSVAAVTETSCIQHCTNDHGPASAPCYGDAFGIHGNLGRDESGRLSFRLDDRVVEARRKYSTVTAFEMRVDTGSWR